MKKSKHGAKQERGDTTRRRKTEDNHEVPNKMPKRDHEAVFELDNKNSGKTIKFIMPSSTAKRPLKTEEGFEIFIERSVLIPCGKGSNEKISTGIEIQLPEGYDAELHSKRSLATSEHCIEVLGAPAIIRSGRAIAIHLKNSGAKDYRVVKGHSVALLVIRRNGNELSHSFETRPERERGEERDNSRERRHRHESNRLQ